MRNETQSTAASGLLQYTALMTAGAVTGLILTLAGLLLCAFLTAAGTIPESAMRFVTAVACAVGACVSGFLGAKSIGKRALVIGLVTGVVFFLILVILGALFLEGLFPKDGVVMILLASIIGAALGSVLQATLKQT